MKKYIKENIVELVTIVAPAIFGYVYMMWSSIDVIISPNIFMSRGGAIFLLVFTNIAMMVFSVFITYYIIDDKKDSSSEEDC